MAKIDTLVPSKSSFLKKEDVGELGINLRIKAFEMQDVGKDGESETKLTVSWMEPAFKPMVVNHENASRLKMVLKTDDTDQMIGRTVCVYSDPYVAFAGKTVGGLRIRQPSGATKAPQARPRPAPAQAAAEVEDDQGPDTPPLDAYAGEFDKDIPF